MRNLIKRSVLPEACPDCGHKLEWDGVDLVCSNKDCGASKFNRLYRWLSYVGGVKGVGYSGICDFIEYFKLSKIEDIYDNYTEYTMKVSIAGSDLGSVTKSKYEQVIEKLFGKIDPRYAICGLNIEGLGWGVADLLVRGGIVTSILVYDDSSRVVDQLYHLKGIGSSTVSTIMENIEMIKYVLSSIHLDLDVFDELKGVSTENVRYFCVTGSLEFGSRNEFCEFMKSKGWEWSDISKAEYLVTNNPDPASSKGRKAKQLNIPIISEREFLEIVSK